MSRKEAVRRLEELALENGFKKNHYVKRALVEFLERQESLLVRVRSSQGGGIRSPLDAIASRLYRYPN